MVIQKFNKLIRNRWLWGAFAIAISAFFAFDFLIADLGGDSRSESVGGAGTLAGEPVDARLFADLVEDARGFGRGRDSQSKQGDVNRRAWESCAALLVADRVGVAATDADVRALIRNDPSFRQNGGFSFALYRRALRDNGLAPERFEEFLKRRLTLMRLYQSVLGAAAWVSPMELDSAVSDLTDTFTVKVASFSQDKKDADAVKVDDAALKAWYEKNLKSLELPERVKIRYVRCDATATNVLDRMSVTEDEMRDYYDATIDSYTTTDTNGVEQVRPFDEVKSVIARELRLKAAVQCLETNLNFRAYSQRAAKGSSRIDEIAKEDGLKVRISDWFAPGGEYQEGFMKRTYQICPGAKGLVEAVAELDPESEDLRYAVVSSPNAVWLVEKAETSPRHVPTFEEAKEAIRPRALRDAKADAFRAQVEAVAKKGAAAVEAVKGVSTNLTFCVADVAADAEAGFANAQAVARAAMRLKKGEVSGFTLTSPGRAVLVVCVDRAPGDPTRSLLLRSQVRDDLAALQLRPLPEAWTKWNLERLGFEPGEISSVENPEETDE